MDVGGLVETAGTDSHAGTGGNNKMQKKYLYLYLILLALFGLGWPAYASAVKITITEVMYDLPGADDNHEWIEIQNQSGGPIDLTGWKVVNGSSTTKHGINLPGKNGSVGSIIVAAGAYVILADNAITFLSDHQNFSGTVLDTVLSLNNTGAILKILDNAGSIIDSVTYSNTSGAVGDGNSLQKNGSIWITALPTPGASNKTEAAPPVENSLAGSSGQGEGSSSATSTSTKPTKISVKIEAPKYVIAEASFDISAIVTGLHASQSGIPALPAGPPAPAGRYVWNFGNGEVVEVKDRAFLNYTYQFPGSYMIILNFYKDEKSEPIKITAKIKVEKNPIIISSIKEDGSVEIHNKATHQIDFSGWVVTAGDKSFKIPSKTVLVAGGKIVLSATLLKFSADEKDVRLLYPSGKTAYIFGENLKKNSVTAQIKSSSSVKNTKNAKAAVPKSAEDIKELALISDSSSAGVMSAFGKSSTASAISAINNRETESTWPYVAGLLFLIGIATASVVFLRKSAADIASPTKTAKRAKAKPTLKKVAKEYKFIE